MALDQSTGYQPVARHTFLCTRPGAPNSFYAEPCGWNKNEGRHAHTLREREARVVGFEPSIQVRYGLCNPQLQWFHNMIHGEGICQSFTANSEISSTSEKFNLYVLLDKKQILKGLGMDEMKPPRPADAV
jgi:hypothetical protein